MKSYLVGGAVRDALLGLPVKDKDWVVVGATPEAMIDAGYQQVGRDFPVFLHPKSREEYARRVPNGNRVPVIPASPAMPRRMSRWSRTYCAAISPLTPRRRTKTAILSTSTAARTICATVFYAIFPRLF